MLNSNLEWIAKPEDVFATRTNLATGMDEALIRWANLPEEKATWEEVEELKHQFPTFHQNFFVEPHLGDVVNLEGG